MNKYAVIVAGGSGTRMGVELPKQFMLLADKPLLYYTLKTFLEAFEDLQVILVLPADHTEKGRELIDAWFDEKRIQVCIGGETRFHSVKNGLELVQGDAIVFVHDAVRCLLTTDLVKRCYDAAVEHGTAIPVVPSKDSVRILSGEENNAIERERVVLVQTPQTFHSGIIQPAFNIDHKEKFTDEASVVEAYGLKLHLVNGEETNIKITVPSDLALAEAILRTQLH
jgi:2-C-methyl-D-erythritol 4-phosphate cytidylyltransferase